MRACDSTARAQYCLWMSDAHCDSCGMLSCRLRSLYSIGLQTCLVKLPCLDSGYVLHWKHVSLRGASLAFMLNHGYVRIVSL